jgi:hypothetical protein
VLTLTIDASRVLAYVNQDAGRNEEEFIVLVSSTDRVRRVHCDVQSLARCEEQAIDRRNQERLERIGLVE